MFLGHDIVATFNVEKPVLLLQDNILHLEDDIFAEINLAAIRVCASQFFFFTILMIMKLIFPVLWTGSYLICGAFSWIKFNKDRVCYWSWYQKFKNIHCYRKFDKGILSISSYTPNIPPFDYILVWQPILVWGAKVPWRNYRHSSSECISSAESADLLQLHLKLLHRANTSQFWRS